MDDTPDTRPGGQPSGGAASFALTWFLLALFWIGLSGPQELLQPLPAFMAFVSVTLVSAASHRHLTQEGALGPWRGRLWRMPRYLVYLTWEILKANWDMALRILAVRPIEPRVFRYRPGMGSDFGHTVLANSITLTPGTVVVDEEEDGTLVIHAISREAEEGVTGLDMERQVRRLDGEG